MKENQKLGTSQTTVSGMSSGADCQLHINLDLQPTTVCD